MTSFLGVIAPYDDAGVGLRYNTAYSLLLHSNRSTGSSTIVDASAYAHVNTNVNVLHSDTQSKFGGTALHFNNLISNNFIVSKKSDEFAFNLLDFTIDFWIYPTIAQVNKTILGNLTSPGEGDTTFHLGYANNAVNLIPIFHTYDTTLLESSTALTLNAWNHLAVTRKENTFYMFVNGILTDSITMTIDLSASKDLFVGQSNVHLSSNGSPTCYMDELRIVKNGALWSSGFIPPTLEASETIPAQPNPDILLHFNGVNAGTTFIDSSLVGHAVTANGTAQLSTANARFQNDDNAALITQNTLTDADYISVTYESDLLLGVIDFTIDFWCKDTIGYPTGDGDYLITQNLTTSSAPGNWGISFTGTASNRYLKVEWINAVSVLESHTGTTDIDDGEWHHIAMTRTASTLYLFIDGVLEFSDGTAGLINFNAPNDWYIGQASVLMDEVRAIVGQAMWTTTFEPLFFEYPTPIAPTIQESLLLKFEDISTPTTMVDSSTNLNVVVANGNASITTNDPRINLGSLLLDGTGDYLVVTGDTSITLTNQWTIETWIRPDGLGGQQYIASYDTDWILYIDGNQIKAFFTANGPTTFTLIGTTTMTNGRWEHIAISRVGLQYGLFINGVLEDSASFLEIVPVTRDLYIGSNNTPGNYFNGAIEQFTIYNSDGLYDVDFDLVLDIDSPPWAVNAGALPDSTETSDPIDFPGASQQGITSSNPLPTTDELELFLRGEGINGGAIVDSSINSIAITPIAAAVTTSTAAVGSNGSLDLTTTNKITTDGVTELVFGTNDFTIDFWVNIQDYGPLVTGDPATIPANTWQIEVTTDGFISWSSNIGHDYAIDLINNIDLVLSGWHHIAFVRKTGTFRLFIDGIIIATTSAFGDFNPTTAQLEMGASTNIYMDEFRYAVNVGLWDANFTPPILIEYIELEGLAEKELAGSADTIIGSSVLLFTGTGSVKATAYGATVLVDSNTQPTFNGNNSVRTSVYDTTLFTTNPIVLNGLGSIKPSVNISTDTGEFINYFDDLGYIQPSVGIPSILGTPITFINGYTQPDDYIATILPQNKKWPSGDNVFLSNSTSTPSVLGTSELTFINATHIQSPSEYTTTSVGDGLIFITALSQPSGYMTSLLSVTPLLITPAHVQPSDYITSLTTVPAETVTRDSLPTLVDASYIASQLYTSLVLANGVPSSAISGSVDFVDSIHFVNAYIQPSSETGNLDVGSQIVFVNSLKRLTPAELVEIDCGTEVVIAYVDPIQVWA